MGESPDWYDLIEAARYLGVAPWDLEDAPTYWYKRAIGAMNAVSGAREDQERWAANKRKNTSP